MKFGQIQVNYLLYIFIWSRSFTDIKNQTILIKLEKKFLNFLEYIKIYYFYINILE